MSMILLKALPGCGVCAPSELGWRLLIIEQTHIFG
jgi:hypothetical protein